MLHGSAGKGQHTKMANQLMIAGTMTGLTEMLVYANATGLTLEKKFWKQSVVAVLQTGH